MEALILPQLGLFFWTAFLFLVFFVILRAVAWKPILKAISEREAGIQTALDEAKLAREEMAKLTAQNEALEQSARAAREQIIREANAMRDSIVAQAREEAIKAAAKEGEKAKQQIEAEKMAALTDLKNQAGQMAVDIAERVLRQQFDNRETQVAFANRLVSELSQN